MNATCWIPRHCARLALAPIVIFFAWPSLAQVPRATPIASPSNLSSLGIEVVQIPQELAVQWKISGGVLIIQVQKSSFADQIGMTKGSILKEVNRRPISTQNDLQNELAKVKAGDDIVFALGFVGKKQQDMKYVGGTLPTSFVTNTSPANYEQLAVAFAQTNSKETPTAAVEVPASGSGPTMTQTIDFINTAILKNPVQLHRFDFGSGTATVKTYQRPIALDGTCHLLVPRKTVDTTSGSSRGRIEVNEGKYDIDLTTLAPSAIAELPEKGPSGEIESYKVDFSAKYRQLPLDAPLSDEVESDDSSDLKYISVKGVAHVLSGNMFSVTSFADNQTATYTITKKTSTMSEGQSVSDGDVVSLFYHERKAMKNGSHELDGYVLAEKRDTKNEVRFFDIFFASPDDDTARRVTKALIHAAALCYKAPPPPPPQLF